MKGNNMKLLRLKSLKVKIGLGKTSIHEKIKRGEFPKSIPLGARAVAWLESDIDAWIQAQIVAAGDMK